MNYGAESSAALEKGELLLKQLKAIAQAEDNKLISQRYRLAKASLLKLSEKEEEQMIAYQIFKNIIKEEIVAHELTIFGMINLCEMLFKQYVISGNQEILTKLIQQLESILTLAKEAQRYGIVLSILLLQGKIFLLQFEIKKAQKLFKQIKSEAKKKGYKLIIQQCEHELDKILEYSTLDIILSEQHKEEEKVFRQQQTADIFNYLKDVSLQLQTLDKKG